MNYQQFITIDSNRRSGQATIRGMRIAVKDILELLASGMSWEEILADYPELTQQDIQACLWYASHREQVFGFFR
jgi:uncharacterized protein (DUF433 family)